MNIFKMNKRVKKMLVLFITILLFFEPNLIVFAYNGNWYRDSENWCYKRQDNTYALDEWIFDEEDGNWYRVNEFGYLKTGWFFDEPDWYYLNDLSNGTKGAVLTGWVNVANKWYYLNPIPNGKLGAMQTGWLKYKDHWYYLGNDGTMQTGWLQYKNHWYYLKNDGTMVYNERYNIDGKYYIFDKDGIWIKEQINSSSENNKKESDNESNDEANKDDESDNNTKVKITIDHIIDNVLTTVDENITLSGTVSPIDNVNSIVLEYYSIIDNNIKIVSVEKTPKWESKNIKLDIGTNYIKVKVIDNKKTVTESNITINRISTNIKASENVKLLDAKTTSKEELKKIHDSIVGYWIDKKGTEDTSDDEYNIIVKEESPLYQYIKEGSLKENDIVYIPSCEYFLAGFSFQYIFHGDDCEFDMEYDPSKYEVLHMKLPGIMDIFNDDVSISLDAIDEENPIGFIMVPRSYDKQDNTGMEVQSLLSEENEQFSGYEKYIFAGSENEKGFQFDNLSKYISLDASNKDILLKLNDIILYDADGDSETTYDQLKINAQMGLKDIDINVAYEAHKTDIIPQQMLFKVEYTETMSAKLEWEGVDFSLSQVISDYNEEFNKGYNNSIDMYGLASVSGLDMSSRIVLGSVGLNLTGVTNTNIGNLQIASELTGIMPWVIITFYLDMEGKITASQSIEYKYEVYNEKGINIQEENYIGTHGSVQDNLGTENLSFGSYQVNLYNVEAKSKNEKDQRPESTITLEMKGEGKAAIGVGLSGGLMICGVIPAEIYGKICAEAGFNSDIQIIWSGSNVNYRGNGSIDYECGLKAGASWKLTMTADFIIHESWELLNGHIEFLNIPFIKDSRKIGMFNIYGKVYNKETNEGIDNAKVTLKKEDITFNKVSMTDVTGKFNFDLEKEGIYQITITKDGYQDITTKIDIKEDEINIEKKYYLIPKDFPSTQKGMVKGKILYRSGENLTGEGIRIVAKNLSDHIIQDSILEEDGEFSLELPVGKNTLTFSHVGCIEKVIEITIEEGKINNLGFIGELEIETYGMKSGIIGEVCDEQKNVLENVDIKVYDSDNNEISSTNTNAAGEYKVALEEGEYEIKYSLKDYEIVINHIIISDRVIILEPIILYSTFSKFAGGDGTEENPYQVLTAQQLNAVRDDLDAHYIQIGDINLKNYSNWKPIGDEEVAFSGSYDGAGYIISNLKITNDPRTPPQSMYKGLFGLADENSSIQNIHLKKLDISLILNGRKIGTYRIGGVVGYYKSESLTGCIVEGNIIIELEGYGYAYGCSIGGVVGTISERHENIIENCKNYVDIKVYGNSRSGVSCGGIIGDDYNEDDIPGGFIRIKKCINYGKLSIDLDKINGGGIYCGGIIGTSGSYDGKSNIEYCINYGDVIIESISDTRYGAVIYIGGICGAGDNIYDSINYGNIVSYLKSEQPIYTGSIIGRGNILENVFNLCDFITCYKEPEGIEDIRLGRMIGRSGIVGRYPNIYSLETTTINGNTVTEGNPNDGKSLSKAEINEAIQYILDELSIK